MPSSATLTKSDGVWTRLTASQRRSSATSRNPNAGAIPARRTPWIQEMFSRRASVATGKVRRRRAYTLLRLVVVSLSLHQVLRGRDRLVGGLLAALDLVDGDRVRVGVAVRVDRERPEDAVVDLGLKQLGRDVCARAVTLLDRGQEHLGRLCSVGGVRVHLSARLRGAEVLDELLALRAELLVRLPGDADVHPLGCIARAVDNGGDGREAIRRDQRDVLAEDRDEVLEELPAVLADEPADEDRVGAGLLDLRCEPGVRRRLRVPRREADALDAELVQRVAIVRRDAQAVGLL